MTTDNDRLLKMQKDIEEEKSRQLKLQEIEANKQRLRELEEKREDIRRDTFIMEREYKAKEKARMAFMLEGGNAAEFEVEWPAIRREARRMAAVAALMPDTRSKSVMKL